MRFNLNKCAILAAIGGFVFFSAPVAQGQSASFNQAVQTYRAGQYAKALSQLQTLPKIYQNDPDAHYYLGLCYQAMHQMAQAKEQFEWVAKAAPDANLRRNASLALEQIARYYGPNLGAKPTGSASPETAKPASPPGPKIVGYPKAILFFTTWCPHCKEFEPEFNEAKRKMQGKLDFQSFDAEAGENSAMVAKYNIHRYPWLVYLNGDGSVLFNEGQASFQYRLQQLTSR